MSSDQTRPIVLDIEQVARLLGLSSASVRRMWANGDIPPPKRFGRRAVRWFKSDLEAWAKQLPPAVPIHTDLPKREPA